MVFLQTLEDDFDILMDSKNLLLPHLKCFLYSPVQIRVVLRPLYFIL